MSIDVEFFTKPTEDTEEMITTFDIYIEGWKDNFFYDNMGCVQELDKNELDILQHMLNIKNNDRIYQCFTVRMFMRCAPNVKVYYRVI
jgi:hypothetical protein